MSSIRYANAGESWWLRRRSHFTSAIPGGKSATPSSRHLQGPRVSIDPRTGSVLSHSASWLSDSKTVIRVAFFVAGLGGITLLGLAARVIHISDPMRYDESYNYLNYVSQGPWHIITHYVPNNHIFHTLCVWAVGKVAGHSPAALRIPAFVAGLMLIPATGWLAWTLFRRFSVALLSSLAVCCSSALIEYSVNARGYSMLTLFAVLALQALLRALHLPEMRWRWIGWGILGAAGLFTVPVMILPFLAMAASAAITACTVYDGTRRTSILRGIGWGAATCSVLGCIGYLPVVIFGGMEPFIQSQEMVHRILGQQVASSSQMIAAMLTLWTRHTSVMLGGLLFLGMAVFAVRTLRAKEPNRWMVLGVLILPLLVIAVASAPMPARAWLFALPFLLIVSAQGLDDLFRDESSLQASLCNKGLQSLAALLCLISMIAASKSNQLCSEPGGFVWVEPALAECQSFGPSRCALIAPYTPATAYYQSRYNTPALADPTEPDAQRVYILTNAENSLDKLWHPGVKGYEFFSRPNSVWERQGSRLYVAERVPRNALR